jgi:D-alanyl-D-alanine carboxypeptidase
MPRLSGMSHRAFTSRPSPRAALATLVAVLLAFALAAAGAAAKPMSRADRKFVDEAVAKALKDEHIPGISVEISGPAGTYAKAYGTADRQSGRRLRTDDHIRIASITKTFTATAILRQVAAGKLTLDQTIDTWFPRVPNADEITVRDLLAMRSGLYDFTAEPKFLEEFNADPLLHFGPQDVLKIVEDHHPVAAPDTVTHYTDANYVLLGLILEKVTGETAEAAITKDVIEPLGLKHTSFPTTAKMPAPYSHGYYGGDGKLSEVDPAKLKDYTAVNPRVAWCAGAMVSTLGDLHKYARELGTGRLLPESLWAERLRFGPLATGGVPVGYGLGILHVGKWLGHDGAIFGFSTVTMYEPVHKWTITAAGNLSSNFSTPTLTLFSVLATHFDPDSFKGAPEAPPAN